MKRAVVTGGSSGMGKATLEELERNGYAVTNWDLSSDPAVDVSSTESVAEAVERLGGSIDAAILAAGVWGESTLDGVSDDLWDRMMNINGFGVLNSIRALEPVIAQGGAIGVISSAAGMRGTMYETAYVASKFAVSGMVEALAPELAQKRIRINAVCPFHVRTPMTDAALIEKEEATGITVEESYQMEADAVPLGRVADASEIADLLYYLVSDKSSYVTGAVIPISGGAHCGYGQVLTSID